MAENRTQPTDASVDAYLSTIEASGRRNDCRAICALMSKITQCPPIIRGPGIVGFGSYHYTYASGRQGAAPVAGSVAEIKRYYG